MTARCRVLPVRWFSPACAGAAAAVPEPATLSVVGLAMFALASRLRRGTPRRAT